MNAPIPVVIATGQLGLGGGERQLYLMLRHLDRSAYAPAVVTFNPGHADYWEGPIRDLGVRVHTVGKSANKVARLYEFTSLLRRLGARIVHSWDFRLNGATALCGRLARVPVRLGGLRRNLYRPNRTAWQRRLGTTGLDRFVANSTRGKDDLVRLGVEARRVDVVFNSVEALDTAMAEDERRRLRAAWGVAGEDEIVMVNIGNFIAVKDHRLLLEVSRALLDRGLPWRLVIYGDGPLRGEIEAHAKRLALGERVRLAGRDPDAARHLPAADLFGFTSRSEGCPNVLLEAAAAGLPVVTTDVGGAADIVAEGETGFVVPLGDGEALADRLSLLAGDAARRLRMAEAARARVRSLFAPEQSASTLRGVYDRSLSDRGRD